MSPILLSLNDKGCPSAAPLQPDTSHSGCRRFPWRPKRCTPMLTELRLISLPGLPGPRAVAAVDSVFLVDQLPLPPPPSACAADFHIAVKIHTFRRSGLSAPWHNPTAELIVDHDVGVFADFDRSYAVLDSQLLCRIQGGFIARASTSVTPPYFIIFPASMFRCRICSASSLLMPTTTILPA